MTTRIPPNHCLNCGALHDSATSVTDDAMPYPGAITICLKCGHVMAFDDKLCFRPLTDEEIIAAAGDPRIVQINKLRELQAKWKPRR